MLGLIDESAPESARGVHYVIGTAVLIDPTEKDEVRLRVRKLIGDRRRVFHWKGEGIELRTKMIDLLGELGVGVFAVIHRPVAARRQTVARDASLRSLTSMLCREGVDNLLIESRGPQDADDRRTLVDAINGGDLPAALTYEFAGKDDALLWLPDAVAGVFGEAECRRSNRWIAELQRKASVFEVRRLDAHEPRLPS